MRRISDFLRLSTLWHGVGEYGPLCFYLFFCILLMTKLFLVVRCSLLVASKIIDLPVCLLWCTYLFVEAIVRK